MVNVFTNQLKRDLLGLIRSPDEILNPLVFYLLVVTLFVLGSGGDRGLLVQLAPALIWVNALLATLLSLEGFFRRDFDDGTLEQTVLLGQPLAWVVLAKVLAHWLVTGLPLTILAPVIAAVLAVPAPTRFGCVLVLLLGTPTLTLLGAIGAALTVGLRRGGVLLALIVLPLYIPVLIFGVSWITSSMQGLDNNFQLYMLAALLMFTLAAAPFAIAAALRISVEN